MGLAGPYDYEFNCGGAACVDHFSRLAECAEKNMVEIRNAGKLGLGVFARRDIPQGQVLGEYLGQILPFDEEQDQLELEHDRYQFTLESLGCISKFTINLSNYYPVTVLR
jgi:hypothetical protein